MTMRLRSVETKPSPRADGWIRLEARVEYDDAPREPEVYWLEVPIEHSRALVTTGDPWLVLLAPLAVTLGSTLRVDMPVHGDLLAGARDVIDIWARWFPHLRSISIDAPVVDNSIVGGNRGLGSFFSGGVDSFFTALRHRPELDALVFVWGFDIPRSNPTAWHTALAANETVAQELGLTLIPVVTNLRETRFARTNWTRLSHGAALAGVAQALGGMFQTVLIPSSASYRDLRPWGSHPETDARFTSRRVRIVHDGAEWRRAEKTEAVAESELALRHLRVCYASERGTNCGRCKRCYRTMLALEAIGALGRCTAFGRDALDLDKAQRLYCDDEPDAKQFGFVRELARREGRLEIVRAIDGSLRRSTRMLPLVKTVRWLRRRPLFWRWAPTWEERLLRRWVV